MDSKTVQKITRPKNRALPEIVICIRDTEPAQHPNSGVFALALSGWLKNLGIPVWVGCSDSEAVLRIHDIEPQDVDELISVVASYLAKRQSFKIVQRHIPATPLPGENGDELPPNTVLHERLTKRLLMILPTGSNVVSNCCDFDEVLGPRETREETWKCAVKKGAAGRLISCIPQGTKRHRMCLDAKLSSEPLGSNSDNPQ